MTYDFRSIPGYRLAEITTAGIPSAIECRLMLKATRLANGLTQGAMAYLIGGINVGSLRAWELGYKNPSALARKRISDVCRELGERDHRG